MGATNADGTIKTAAMQEDDAAMAAAIAARAQRASSRVGPGKRAVL
jgi:hypothetical protein